MNSVIEHTVTQYQSIIGECRHIYLHKVKDYGTSWRILRPMSITDQIFIKARRIRTIEETGVSLVNEKIDDEFRAIVNYAIIALIQMELPAESRLQLTEDEAIKYYDHYADKIKDLMMAKNHDYGEAWRDMRHQSFTDLILMKLLRVKQIEANEGKTQISEGIEAHYMDMVNYAVFALIKLKEDQ